MCVISPRIVQQRIGEEFENLYVRELNISQNHKIIVSQIIPLKTLCKEGEKSILSFTV